MGFRERLFRGENPGGIKIERRNYSPSGDIPLPLAMKRAEELKNRNRGKRLRRSR